jgi:hypothetical protein
MLEIRFVGTVPPRPNTSVLSVTASTLPPWIENEAIFTLELADTVELTAPIVLPIERSPPPIVNVLTVAEGLTGPKAFFEDSP